MDQVSRPLLALLAAVAGFGALWLGVLRPRAADVAQAPPAAAPAAPARPAAARLAPGLEPATAAEAAAVRDIRGGKVVVVLFWSAQGADDVATRAAVRELDRRGGRVAVHLVAIERIGRYPTITDGVRIDQAPTTLVIDRRGRAREIVGLTEPGELRQAVDDALARRR